MTGGMHDSGADMAQGVPTIDLKKVKPFIPTNSPDHYLADEEPISPLVKWDEKDEKQLTPGMWVPKGSAENSPVDAVNGTSSSRRRNRGKRNNRNRRKKPTRPDREWEGTGSQPALHS